MNEYSIKFALKMDFFFSNYHFECPSMLLVFQIRTAKCLPSYITDRIGLAIKLALLLKNIFHF